MNLAKKRLELERAELESLEQGESTGSSFPFLIQTQLSVGQMKRVTREKVDEVKVENVILFTAVYFFLMPTFDSTYLRKPIRLVSLLRKTKHVYTTRMKLFFVPTMSFPH
jgi:hypothetical protein